MRYEDDDDNENKRKNLSCVGSKVRCFVRRVKVFQVKYMYVFF